MSRRLSAKVTIDGVTFSIDCETEWPSGWVVKVSRDDSPVLVRESVTDSINAALVHWRAEVVAVMELAQLTQPPKVDPENLVAIDHVDELMDEHQNG